MSRGQLPNSPGIPGYGQSDDGHALDVSHFAAEAVPGGAHAGARARRLVHRELEGRLPADALADVSLLTTELIANGVWHGGADEGTTLRVSVSGNDAAVRVEVENPDDAPGDPVQRRPDLDGGGGLGLHIVERVASRWGVRHAPRVAVWFELDRDPRGLL
jgi:anti-sigma regulatory factor (Ser/Thr protein kinase)